MVFLQRNAKWSQGKWTWQQPECFHESLWISKTWLSHSLMAFTPCWFSPAIAGPGLDYSPLSVLDVTHKAPEVFTLSECMCLLARHRSEYCHLSIGAEAQPLNKTSLTLKGWPGEADLENPRLFFFLRKSITFQRYFQICIMCFLILKQFMSEDLTIHGIIRTQRGERVQLKIYLFHNTPFCTSLMSIAQKLMRERKICRKWKKCCSGPL